MKIIGVTLIKNEDLYIEKVINNIIDFCDELLVLENYSEDKTYEIVSVLSQNNPKIKLIRVENAFDTHKYVEPYIGPDTWVFRVDGDELYDRVGLVSFKTELLSGKYNTWFNLASPCLNVFNLENGQAKGYLGAMSSLVNFGLLESWHEEKSERLHGGHKIFKPGFDVRYMKCPDLLKLGFEQSTLRCLHLCFVKRSSLDKNNQARLNPSENKSRWAKLKAIVRNILTLNWSGGSFYKNKIYKQGEERVVDTTNFL